MGVCVVMEPLLGHLSCVYWVSVDVVVYDLLRLTWFGPQVPWGGWHWPLVWWRRPCLLFRRCWDFIFDFNSPVACRLGSNLPVLLNWFFVLNFLFNVFLKGLKSLRLCTCWSLVWGCWSSAKFWLFESWEWIFSWLSWWLKWLSSYIYIFGLVSL